MPTATDERIIWILDDRPPLPRIDGTNRPSLTRPLFLQHNPDRLPRLPAPDPMDTLDVCASWRVWLEASYAPATVRTYWGVIWRFFAACPVPVGQVNAEHIAGFLATYPYRSASRRTYYQALRLFFRYCEQRHIILVDPTEGIRVPAVIEKVPRALTPDEVWRLAVAAHAAAPIRGCFVLTLYYTAARLSEAQALRWSDVEGDELRLRVTKGGRERLVPIGAGLGATLDYLRILQPAEQLFPRSGQTLWKWVRDAGRSVGIDAHPHLLRSTAATAMLVRGARPHAVRALLGHQSIRTTQRYWAHEKADLELAAGLL